MDTLPFELISNIFAMLNETDRYKNVTLVCKSFRDIMYLPVLRTSMTIDPKTSISRLEAWMEKSPLLSHIVIRPPPAFEPWDGFFQGFPILEFLDQFLLLVCQLECVHLKSISINGHSFADINTNVNGMEPGLLGAVTCLPNVIANYRGSLKRLSLNHCFVSTLNLTMLTQCLSNYSSLHIGNIWNLVTAKTVFVNLSMQGLFLTDLTFENMNEPGHLEPDMLQCLIHLKKLKMILVNLEWKVNFTTFTGLEKLTLHGNFGINPTDIMKMNSYIEYLDIDQTLWPTNKCDVDCLTHMVKIRNMHLNLGGLARLSIPDYTPELAIVDIFKSGYYPNLISLTLSDQNGIMNPALAEYIFINYPELTNLIINDTIIGRHLNQRFQ